MNILFVSQFYYPDNFRLNDIVSMLVSQGNNVKVLTGLPDYTTGHVPKEFRFFRRRKELINGAQTVRLPIIARRSGTVMRILNYGSFVLSSSLYALFTRDLNYDTIFVNQTSPITQVLPAIILKNRMKTKLTLYCCDLWPESMKAWNVSESSFIFRIVRKMSAWIYNRCDTIAITSKPFAQYLEQLCGSSLPPVVYLPQHAEDLYADICGEYEDNSCIDFLFAGNIGAVQDVECILQAIPQIKTNANYKVHVVGDGSSLASCKILAESLGVTNQVIFHGRHSLEEMKSFYKLADCFLLTLRGGDSIGLTLPGKAQGYLSAGKPVVGAIDGAGCELIAESDCGLCSPAGDFAGLGACMAEVIEHFELYRQKGLNGRKFYEEHFTEAIFMQQLLALLNQ